MLTTTKATISVNGAILSSSRDGFLTDTLDRDAFYEVSRENIRAYGIDLLMFAEGDLFVNETNEFTAKDLKEVGSLLNYAQALTHRLMTDRGTHPEDRFFGVPWSNYIGQPYSSSGAIKSKLVAEITEEIYKDRRTQEVYSVSAEFTSPTVVEVSCSVIPFRFQNSVVGISLLVEDI